MTVERQDGKTGRPRPSRVRAGALRASDVVAPVRPVPAPIVVEAAEPKRPAAATKPNTTKYTALLDDNTAASFDELALVARRKLGRKVDKSELLRALVLLAADDASLRDQLIDLVRDATPRA